MTNTMSYEDLEQRAAQQRRQLHNSVTELRLTVKEKLDVKKNATQYLGPAAIVAAIIGLGLGYGLTGMFTRD
jgi:hypothetical protein